MTKEAALHKFWSSFGLTAYEENSVPTGVNSPDYPYITYSVSISGFDVETPLTASLWDRGTSWINAINKENEIFQKIGMGGVFLPCDHGSIWIKRGSPFSQSMGDPIDELIKRKYINITAEFLTAE